MQIQYRILNLEPSRWELHIMVHLKLKVPLLCIVVANGVLSRDLNHFRILKSHKKWTPCILNIVYVIVKFEASNVVIVKDNISYSKNIFNDILKRKKIIIIS